MISWYGIFIKHMYEKILIKRKEIFDYKIKNNNSRFIDMLNEIYRTWHSIQPKKTIDSFCNVFKYRLECHKH